MNHSQIFQEINKMIKPNLPDRQVNKVIMSSDASEEILCKLMSHDIIPIKLTGHLKCDEAVKNHPDFFLTAFLWWSR